MSTIFDLFTQVAHTLDRSQGGIGLTLVKRLVEMQGGSVSAFSAGKDLGSEFTVRLPALPVDQRIAAGRLAAERYAPSSPGEFAILIVDDNRDATDSMAMLLGMEGYDVRVAYDGPQALDAMRASRPDVILLDIGLPGMDGFQVAERVRAEPDNRAIVIVAVSGYGQEEHRAARPRPVATTIWSSRSSPPSSASCWRRCIRGGTALRPTRSCGYAGARSSDEPPPASASRRRVLPRGALPVR